MAENQKRHFNRFGQPKLSNFLMQFLLRVPSEENLMNTHFTMSEKIMSRIRSVLPYIILPNERTNASWVCSHQHVEVSVHSGEKKKRNKVNQSMVKIR